MQLITGQRHRSPHNVFRIGELIPPRRRKPPPVLFELAPPLEQWSFHVDADAWLDAFSTGTGITPPPEWAGSTLAVKYAIAQQLWADYLAGST